MGFTDRFTIGHFSPNAYRHRGVTCTDLTVKESLTPLAVVTMLFFLWGISYGFLDSINSHVQTVMGISQTESTYFQIAYFGAYFVCPMCCSGFIIRKWGYRVNFIFGLVVCSIGGFLFWPSAKYESFWAMCCSMAVVGFGLSALETAANPYSILCGPPQYTEIRVCVCQSIQGVGSFVAPLVASHAFYNGANAYSLTNLQWVYCAVAVFELLLAVFFFFVDIPEISDDELERLAPDAEGIYDTTIPLKKQWKFWWAVIAQFGYIGGQVSIASFFITYAYTVADIPKATGSNYLSVGQALFTAFRFIFSFMLKYVKSHYIYTFCISMCIIFSLLASVVPGKGGVACFLLIFPFESCCFPLIFGMGLKGLGHHSKKAAPFLVSAIVGGVLFSPLTGVMADNVSTHYCMFIPMIGYIIATTYGVFAIREFRKLDKQKALLAENDDEEAKAELESVEPYNVDDFKPSEERKEFIRDFQYSAP